MATKTRTKHLTIMFVDIAGFTSATSVMSRSEIDSLLAAFARVLKPIIAEFEGNVVKTMGDAYVVTFESPTNSVLCAMKMQDALAENSKKSPKEKIDARIGINSGEVNIKDNDIFGEAVNIASRIEGIAKAGEIYLTEAVYLSMNKSEIPSAEIGYRYLKGIPEQIKVYKVINEPGFTEKSHRDRVKMAENSNKLSKTGENRPFWQDIRLPIAVAVLVIAGIWIIITFPSAQNMTGDLQLNVFLVNDAGTPIRNLEVDVNNNPGPPQNWGTSFTDKDGMATFYLKQGVYYVYFNMNGFPEDLKRPDPRPVRVSEAVNNYTITIPAKG